MAAVEAMGLQIISDLLKDFIAYIPNGITAIAILILGIVLADAIKKARLRNLPGPRHQRRKSAG